MRFPAKLRTGLLAFTIAFSGAAAPGPMLALVIGQTLAGGVVPTLFILAGHAALEAVVVLLLILGLGRIIARKGVSCCLSIVGGLVLGWMGLTLLLDLGEMTLAGGDGGRMPWYSLILGGMAVSISNPYFTSWWATVGTGQMATLKLKSFQDYLAFWLGHEMGDVGWYVPLSVILVIGCRWLTDGLYRWILGGCGLVIVGLGLVFVVLGIRRLLPGESGEGGEAPGAEC